MELLHSEITEKIISSFFTVYNKLGYGFLEKVYENSLLIELNKRGFSCQAQKHVKVFYDENEVGHYVSDIIVEDCVLIEVKAAEVIVEEHEFQLINYLRDTEIEVGLLVNFGKTPQFKRKVFQNKSV